MDDVRLSDTLMRCAFSIASAPARGTTSKSKKDADLAQANRGDVQCVEYLDVLVITLLRFLRTSAPSSSNTLEQQSDPPQELESSPSFSQMPNVAGTSNLPQNPPLPVVSDDHFSPEFHAVNAAVRAAAAECLRVLLSHIPSSEPIKGRQVL